MKCKSLFNCQDISCLDMVINSFGIHKDENGNSVIRERHIVLNESASICNSQSILA